MDFDAFATDYDGTLATDGRVGADTLAALGRARAAGLRLLMVTGRELTDLASVFAPLDTFDIIVVENGAALYTPSPGTVRVLGPPPPPVLVERLAARMVPFSVGHSIVATVVDYEREVVEAIRGLDLHWHVVRNKESLMVLPPGIDKASGLAAALEALALPAHRTVAIGDAENDQPFLRACGLAVAVANALGSLKAGAHVVTQGAQGAGVIECIDRLLAGEFDGAARVVTSR